MQGKVIKRGEMGNQIISKKDLDKLEGLFNNALSDVGNIPTDASSDPSYPDTINDFMLYLSSSVWNNFDYNPETVSIKIQEPGYLEDADIDEIRSVLTWVHRTELFCDAHWRTVLESDLLPKIINRLKSLI